MTAESGSVAGKQVFFQPAAAKQQQLVVVTTVLEACNQWRVSTMDPQQLPSAAGYSVTLLHLFLTALLAVLLL